MATEVRSDEPFSDLLMCQGLKLRATTRPDYAATLADGYIRDGSPVTIIAHNGNPDSNHAVLTGDAVLTDAALTEMVNAEFNEINIGNQHDIPGLATSLLSRGASEIRMYHPEFKTYVRGTDPMLIVAARFMKK